MVNNFSSSFCYYLTRQSFEKTLRVHIEVRRWKIVHRLHGRSSCTDQAPQFGQGIQIYPFKTSSIPCAFGEFLFKIQGLKERVGDQENAKKSQAQDMCGIGHFQ